jgi:4-diphosphocytidyl-2-C-methyl-D-erythritol kinase
MRIREQAPAKINLTLRVLGRRADGYHELESLVVFADVADGVTLIVDADEAPGGKVAVSGPFAADIVGDNLLDRALALLREADGALRLGPVELEKNLPVAAGLGGGSADAAALLRAVQRANLHRAPLVPWRQVAARLGSDVTVCLVGAPAVMRGRGERIEPRGRATGRGALAAVLANPRVALATGDVFRGLAGAVPERPPRPVPAFADLAALLDHMRAVGNDLEAPAMAMLPVIGEVKAALADQPGCICAAMSGSGPTCFGLFEDQSSAAGAAAALAAGHPGWWVADTRLDFPA